MSLPERWNWGGCLYPNPSRCAAPVGRGQRGSEYGGTTVESRADRTVSGLMSLLACATGFPSSLGKRTILCLISASFTINGDAGTETRREIRGHILQQTAANQFGSRRPTLS